MISHVLRDTLNDDDEDRVVTNDETVVTTGAFGPGGNVPIVKVRGAVQSKTERNTRPKHSNFLLTISTNQSYRDDDPHIQSDIQIFDHTIQQILNNVHQYVRIPEGDWTDEKIKDVDIQYTIEIGPRTKALHIHILFRFTHHSKILLNYEAIRSKICGDLGLKNIYMQNKLVRNSGSQNIIDYLNKGV